jgi:Predicted oxidoreductases (related to aryl-alcohol dehydrogenases)
MLRINNTELDVSPLCLGTVGYGTAVGDDDARRQMDVFLDGGGNFIDTAHVYGDWGGRGPGLSERVIGDWLAETGRRRQVVLVTKGAHPKLDAMTVSRLDGDSIRSDIQASLSCLRTDYIDLYFLHRDDPAIPAEEILGTLEQAHARGDIRYYGCSNWSLKRLEEAQRAAAKAGLKGFVCNQLMWSLADINYNALHDETMVPMEQHTYAYHQTNRLSAMAYTSIAKGYFTRRESGGELPSSVADLYENDSNERIYQYLRANKPQDYTIMELCLLYFRGQPFSAIPIASFSSGRQLALAMESLNKEYPADLMEKAARMKRFVYGFSA